ncbi:hypothetical protein WA026_006197 [Henosepilachna vigintioctopunctata]|uniref:MOB kinase activator-like 4 n=1 Tax=Henosepilachna vigintioctopunctata TaxID=420089 RepID=A0AAW1TI04_9CUCU
MSTEKVKPKRNKHITREDDLYRNPGESIYGFDSTLAIQNYIREVVREDPSNIQLILKKPVTLKEGIWKFEHLKQFCREMKPLVIQLQQECKPDTCDEMTGTEQWIFLCAAHEKPRKCPAIDYINHTLEGSTCLLNSKEQFPTEAINEKSSIRKMSSVCRRIYRILSHAYYHHRSIFDAFESETCLCKRLTFFATKYNLVAQNTLTVPIFQEDVLVEFENYK